MRITLEIDNDGHLWIQALAENENLMERAAIEGGTVDIRWHGLHIEHDLTPGQRTHTGIRIRSMMLVDEGLVHMTPEAVAEWEVELDSLRRQLERREEA